MAQESLPENRVVSLRPAQTKDIPGIAALGSQVFASTFGYSMPAPDLEVYLNSAYSPSSITADLDNPHITIIVACNNLDSVIGFVQLTEGTMEDCLKGSEKPVELQRLYVSQEYHGEGIGRKLVDCVERLAQERGFVTMWLGVVSITSLCFYTLQTLSLCLMVLALVFDNSHILIC
jgi:ribosomal protein S18 acetylase RimI-like enzyme